MTEYIEKLKREVIRDCKLLAYEIDGANKTIDHLHSRGLIVQEGMKNVTPEEWFFRWIARGKAGYAGMSMEKCADMIWYHPSNPYHDNNPWAETAAQKKED